MIRIENQKFYNGIRNNSNMKAFLYVSFLVSLDVSQGFQLLEVFFTHLREVDILAFCFPRNIPKEYHVIS
jgi:hypothetical protein